jgi:hypothetical protein
MYWFTSAEIDTSAKMDHSGVISKRIHGPFTLHCNRQRAIDELRDTSKAGLVVIVPFKLEVGEYRQIQSEEDEEGL